MVRFRASPTGALLSRPPRGPADLIAECLRDTAHLVCRQAGGEGQGERRRSDPLRDGEVARPEAERLR